MNAAYPFGTVDHGMAPRPSTRFAGMALIMSAHWRGLLDQANGTIYKMCTFSYRPPTQKRVSLWFGNR